MSSQGLRTVDRAMESLLAIAAKAPITPAELSQTLGVPVSTTYRYLSSLRKHGLIWELADATVAPGPRCVQLEAAFRRTFHQSSYRELMAQLSRETGETVALLVPQGDEAICIDTIESTAPLRYSFSKGVAKPMLLGASAKAMLPWLDADWLDNAITTSPDLDDDQRGRLRAELPQIRDRGYATSIGEVDQGVWAVGAPIFKANGALDASVSVIAPHFRVVGAEQRLTELLVATAAAMTNSNGWEHEYAT